MGRSRRTIPEELLLLALDPTTGTTAQPQSLDLGLAGAQLVELALAGRIAPDGDRIAVVMPRPTGDPTLDSALELLRRRGSPVRAVHWIGGPRLGLRQIYLAHLERCGMVHAVAGQMCGVLPTTRYQATDTAISRDIRARLDSAIRTGVPPDPRPRARRAGPRGRTRQAPVSRERGAFIALPAPGPDQTRPHGRARGACRHGRPERGGCTAAPQSGGRSSVATASAVAVTPRQHGAHRGPLGAPRPGTAPRAARTAAQPHGSTAARQHGSTNRIPPHRRPQDPVREPHQARGSRETSAAPRACVWPFPSAAGGSGGNLLSSRYAQLHSRRCRFRAVQRQSHRQTTPVGPGIAPPARAQGHDGRGGGGAAAGLAVEDQPPGERPPFHQPARCPRSLRGVRGRGPPDRRLAHADGQGLAPAGLVARLRRHPVQRLHRSGDGRRIAAGVRTPGDPGPVADPELCRGADQRSTAGGPAKPTSTSASVSGPAARTGSPIPSTRCDCGRSSTSPRCAGWSAASR